MKVEKKILTNCGGCQPDAIYVSLNSSIISSARGRPCHFFFSRHLHPTSLLSLQLGRLLLLLLLLVVGVEMLLRAPQLKEKRRGRVGEKPDEY
jgi:hypothetical protein